MIITGKLIIVHMRQPPAECVCVSPRATPPGSVQWAVADLELVYLCSLRILAKKLIFPDNQKFSHKTA